MIQRRLIDGHTGETVEVECDDHAATEARNEWPRAHGCRISRARDDTERADRDAVYSSWVYAKGTRDWGWQVMDTVEYFHPYSNGASRPDGL
jgi:TusA-related sulfurtransferase